MSTKDKESGIRLVKVITEGNSKKVDGLGK